MGVRTNVELTVQLGQNNQLVDFIFERDLTALLDTLDHATAIVATLADAETNFVVPFGDVAEARLVYIEADGEVDVTFGGVLATAAIVTGVGGTYPTGFVGGETLELDIDNGGSFTVTFTVGASLLADVINEINAAAALTGLAPIASDSGGQLRLTSPTTGPTSEVEVVAGGTALATLGLTATVVNGLSGTPGTSPVSVRRPADPAGASAAAGVDAFLLATVRTTSITVDNLAGQEVRLRVALAGDLVTPTV
jgi:hypothetical protein